MGKFGNQIIQGYDVVHGCKDKVLDIVRSNFFRFLFLKNVKLLRGKHHEIKKILMLKRELILKMNSATVPLFQLADIRGLFCILL